MTAFSIDRFAADCKQAMAESDNATHAAKTLLERTIAENATGDIIDSLQAAVPEGASIGEMIVHASPELTMLYARVPPRFQSGIHNHTIFACIGQLEGRERNTIFEKTDDGSSLRIAREMELVTGEVCYLPPDVIHSIENPDAETSSALHIYGGDFGAIMDRRSLWTWDGHEKIPFTFEALLRESAKAMKLSGNDAGLAELVKSIPTAAALLDAI